jgi:putative transposase
MARLPRVVVADVAHHVTQRGNARQFLLATDSERMVYLKLTRQVARARLKKRKNKYNVPSVPGFLNL